MKKYIYCAVVMSVAAALCLLSHEPVLWLASIVFVCGIGYCMSRGETIYQRKIARK